MAEEQRENSAEGTAGVVSSVATNTHTGSPKRKKFIVAGTILLLAATLLAGGFLLFSKLEVGNKYALSVSDGNTKVGLTKEQYDTLYNQAREDGYPEDQIKQAITDGLKYQIVAKTFNLIPTDKQVHEAARATTNFKTGDQLNEWQRLYSTKEAALGNQKVIQNGGYKVATYIYQSDLPYYTVPFDEKMAAEARAYALDRVQQDYQKISADPSAAENVISSINSDPRLIGASGSNNSRIETIDRAGVIYVSPNNVTKALNEDVVKAITDIGNRVGMSDIRAQQYSVPNQPSNTITGYYFAQILEVLQQNTNINQDVKNSLSNMEVKDDIK